MDFGWWIGPLLAKFLGLHVKTGELEGGGHSTRVCNADQRLARVRLRPWKLRINKRNALRADCNPALPRWASYVRGPTKKSGCRRRTYGAAWWLLVGFYLAG